MTVCWHDGGRGVAVVTNLSKDQLLHLSLFITDQYLHLGQAGK